MGGIPRSWVCELEFILQESQVEVYPIKISTCMTAFLNCLTCDLLTQCHQSHANHSYSSQNLHYRTQPSNNLQDPPTNRKLKAQRIQQRIPSPTAYTQITDILQRKNERERERYTSRDQVTNSLESQSTNLSPPANILLGIYLTEMETCSHKNLYTEVQKVQQLYP